MNDTPTGRLVRGNAKERIPDYIDLVHRAIALVGSNRPLVARLTAQAQRSQSQLVSQETPITRGEAIRIMERLGIKVGPQ